MATEVREEKHFHKELVVPSRPDSIRKVEEFIDEVRDALEFKEDAYGNVMVAITEAVNNSIHHGNNLDESKTVRLICESPNAFRLIVEVLDQGTGFDPNDLGDPTAVENIEKPGGRGVFLMRHLSDEISFTDEGRRVRMVFNI